MTDFNTTTETNIDAVETTTEASTEAKATKEITTAKHARFLAEAARKRAEKFRTQATEADETAAKYDELAAMLESEFDKIDGLLHNAAIIGPRTPLEQLSGDNFMRVMQINVNAMFMLTSTLLPLLKLSDDASVVFTSSSVGRKGRAYWGAYAVSKFATEGLMQTLADEVDGISNVRANSINPGATRTSMRAQAYPGENPTNNPEPEAIMPVYLYLMGPDSKGVNGQAFDAQ